MVKDSNYKRAVKTLKCLLSIWEADKKDSILKDIQNINDIDEKTENEKKFILNMETCFKA